MVAKCKTSLSVGEELCRILGEDESVREHVTRIFPIAVPKNTLLPYLVYRRSSLTPRPIKSTRYGADSVEVEMTCYASTYDASVGMAEAVRNALDHIQGRDSLLRNSTLINAEEGIDGDAYAQILTFSINK